MSNQGKKLIGIVVLVFIVTTIFVIKNKKVQKRALRSSRGEFIIESKKSVTARSKLIEEKRTELLKKKALKMKKNNLLFLKKRKVEWLKKRLPLKSGKIVKTTETGSIFNISMKVVDACNFGDLDAVLGGFKMGEAGEILLTVENVVVGDTSFKPIVIKLNRNELEGGFFKKIKLPPVTKATQLGIYLCRDTKHNSHCNNKNVADVNKIIHKYYFNKPYDGGDSIYFFQYLLVSPTTVTYIENPEIGDEKYKMSQSYFDELGIVSSSGNLRLFDRVKQLNRTIKSIPPSVDTKTNSLVIKLPKRNEARCGKRK
jgi:hypothetical protein